MVFVCVRAHAFYGTEMQQAISGSPELWVSWSYEEIPHADSV